MIFLIKFIMVNKLSKIMSKTKISKLYLDNVEKEEIELFLLF